MNLLYLLLIFPLGGIGFAIWYFLFKDKKIISNTIDNNIQNNVNNVDIITPTNNIVIDPPKPSVEVVVAPKTIIPTDPNIDNVEVAGNTLAENYLYYKGYVGTCAYSIYAKLPYSGKVLNIKENIEYCANCVQGIMPSFMAAVDNYTNPPAIVPDTGLESAKTIFGSSCNEQISIINLVYRYFKCSKVPCNIFIINDINSNIKELGCSWKDYRVGGESPRLSNEGYAGVYLPNIQTIFINYTASRKNLDTFTRIYTHELMHFLGYKHGEFMTNKEISFTTEIIKNIKTELGNIL